MRCSPGSTRPFSSSGVEQLTQLGGRRDPLQRNDWKTELYAKAGMVLAGGLCDARDALPR